MNNIIFSVRKWFHMFFLTSLRGKFSPKCGLTFVAPRGDSELCWPLGRVPTVGGGGGYNGDS